MTSFDDIASKYFPSLSRCHQFYFLLSLIWVINQPFVFFNRLGFLTPQHYCQQPITTATSNWSVSDIVNLSIPYKEDPQDPPQIGQPFSPCTEYDIDRLWPLITKNTTLNEALSLRSVLYPNLTVRECSRGIQFIPSPYLRLSVAHDFKTVCQNRYQMSVSNSLYMAGMFTGFFVAGPLSDNLGRRPVVLWSSVIGLTFGLLTSASVNFWMYSVMRFFIGVNMNVAFVVGCVLLSEWVGKEDRNSATLLRRTQGLLMGEPVLILLFYLIQNWRWTNVAFCYPIIFVAIGFYAWPESPRWLLSQGRVDKCVKVIKTVSARNGKVLDESSLLYLKNRLISLSESMKEVDTPKNEEVIQMIEKSEMRDSETTNRNSVIVAERFRNEYRRLIILFRVPALRRNFIVVIVLFFLEAFLYYGVSFYSVRLQGSPFVIAVLTGMIGIPGNVLQWTVYRFFDRKWPMVAFLSLSTLSFGTAFVLMFLGYHGVPVICMATAATLFVDAVFSMLYIRIAEMFPATHRATALGVSGSIARLGSMAAMYVERLDEMVWAPLPLLIFTLGSAVALLDSLFMPPGKGEMLDMVDVNNN